MASPSGYGTIPTMAAPPTSSALRSSSTYAARLRPWRDLADLSSFSRPESYLDAATRVRRNASIFRANYTLLLLFAVFLSLLYHPTSIIAFLVLFAVLWLPLYFSRDHPISLLARDLDDRLVLLILSVVTLLVLLLIGRVGLNVLVALIVGAAVLAVHGALRGVDDQWLLAPDDEEAAAVGGGGLVSVVGGPMPKTYSGGLY